MDKLDKEKYYKSLFLTYFDGCYGINEKPYTKDTYKMGVCKLEYDKDKNIFIVHLRRPGLLIGKGGKTINKFKEYLGIDVHIVEVNLLN